MFLEKLKCSNCEREIDKNENITIHTNAQNKKEPVFRLFFISTSHTIISISISMSLFN